jgi:hypothetical protein
MQSKKTKRWPERPLSRLYDRGRLKFRGVLKRDEGKSLLNCKLAKA